MVLQNHNSISARFSTTTNPINNTVSDNTDNNNGTMSRQRPLLDLLVALVLVPVLILCALQLEKNLHDMTNGIESRWLVFGLGIGMLVISIIICGYVTHRMGVCMWTGPIDEAGNRTGSSSQIRHINSQADVLRAIEALPPSYDSVVKFDIPPPPYECIVIDVEEEERVQRQVEESKAVHAWNGILHV